MTGEIRIRSCRGGPVLVRGADSVVDDEGARHEVTRPVVALCACGRSALAPWCDGTHKALQPRADR
jgi:CDGSH-type Zn-finger protein